jgi:hypothetical protein
MYAIKKYKFVWRIYQWGVSAPATVMPRSALSSRYKILKGIL